MNKVLSILLAAFPCFCALAYKVGVAPGYMFEDTANYQNSRWVNVSCEESSQSLTASGQELHFHAAVNEPGVVVANWG